MRNRVAARIGAHQLHQFFQAGYLVLPDFLPPELVSRLEPEVDRWVDSGLRQRSISSCVEPEKHGPPPVMEIEMEAHGELAGYAPLLDLLASLMGPVFAFHHMHSDRRAPGAGGKNWHHDYEQSPQTDRARIMVHALHYLGGLDPSMGGLAVLPGSHREVAEKTARHHLGTAELPGEVLIDHLPAGSTVVLHSALFHTRRPAATEPRGPRYMVDSSYCQGGVRWRPVKPHWRHLLARARELELDGGRWPDLFADRHFSEYTAPA